MGRVTVVPDRFTMVSFDAGEIAAVVDRVATTIGFPPHEEIRIEVDERNPLGRTVLASLDPVTITAEGGAFENPIKLRQLSERAVTEVAGRLLYRAFDRRHPGFGSPPPEADLTLQQSTAWDAYSLGRLERRGLAPRKPRRHYHFRNRHGFSDVADAVFEGLWLAEGLTWNDIEAACERTTAALEEAGAR